MKLLLSVLILALSITPALSANRVKTWVAETLTSADLNAEFDNIYIGDIDRTAGRWGSNDDIPIMLGSSQDIRLEWDTTQTTDSGILGLGTGLIFSIMQQADMTTDWGIASQTNPTLFIHSADETAITDYISLFHDQVDGNITVGGGDLNLNDNTVITGTLSATGAVTFTTDLTVANGGTGASTFTDGGILLGSGTSAFTALGVATNGQIPIGDGATDPVLATITGTANQITITNGSGSITLDFPDALIVNGTTPSITVGDGGEEDTLYGLNGNAQDFYYCLDDTADTSIIGLGLTCGTTPIIHFDANQDVLIAEAAETVDGKLHVTSDATTKRALVVSMPVSSSVPAQVWQYAGTEQALLSLTATASTFQLSGRDFGNNVAGAQLITGRNTNTDTEGPAAPSVSIPEADGTGGVIWTDATGDLRIHTAPPTGSSGSPTVTDLAGIEVGAQTSWHALKDNILLFTNYQSALNAVIDTPLYTFNMEGRDFSSSHVIWERDIGAWFSYNDDLSQDQTPSLNIRQMLGHHSGAIIALNNYYLDVNKKILELEHEISQLRSNRGRTLVSR